VPVKKEEPLIDRPQRPRGNGKKERKRRGTTKKPRPKEGAVGGEKPPRLLQGEELGERKKKKKKPLHPEKDAREGSGGKREKRG